MEKANTSEHKKEPVLGKRLENLHGPGKETLAHVSVLLPGLILVSGTKCDSSVWRTPVVLRATNSFHCSLLHSDGSLLAGPAGLPGVAAGPGGSSAARRGKSGPNAPVGGGGEASLQKRGLGRRNWPKSPGHLCPSAAARAARFLQKRKQPAWARLPPRAGHSPSAGPRWPHRFQAPRARLHRKCPTLTPATDVFVSAY